MTPAPPHQELQYLISYYQLLLLKAIKNILNIHKETRSANVLSSIIEDAERSCSHITILSERDKVLEKIERAHDCLITEIIHARAEDREYQRIKKAADILLGLKLSLRTTTQSDRDKVLEKWIKLSECIKKHWGEKHEAPTYQYNKLVKTLDEFTEELRTTTEAHL